jgi:predicted nucleotidyltransferase
MRHSIKKTPNGTPQQRSNAPGDGRLTPAAEGLIGEIRAHEKTLRGYGVERLYIFGSHVRGTNHSQSDLDVLVHFSPRHRGGYFAMARVKATLEDGLGVKTDVQLADRVPPQSAVWREAVRAF